MLTIRLLSAGTALLFALTCWSQKPYKDDPKIVAKLKALGDGCSLTLKRGKRKGRVTNDYSMKMVYAPERETAMYAGGNHNNGRRNDCWEYHLGSNQWIPLSWGEGGDHYFLKGVVMFGMRRFLKTYKDKPGTTMNDLRKLLEPKDRKELDEVIIPWWKKNIVFENGQLTTTKGGPIMPSHTWDGLAYDPIKKRMLWSAGAGPNGLCYRFHCLVHGESFPKMKEKRDWHRRPMWTFDPNAKKWIQYRKDRKKKCPNFRGMGQSLEFAPDQKKFFWYVAAPNVTPHSYQMWSFEPETDKWTELNPNGRTIRALVTSKLAPPEEQVIRYSTKQKKLYGFARSHVFCYDVAGNKWSKVSTDPRVESHDAHVAIAYDSVNDVFIYTRKKTSGKQARIAVFSPATNEWTIPTIKGPKIPLPRWGKLKGFYHTAHNVYVLAAGGDTPVWAFRYKKAK